MKLLNELFNNPIINLDKQQRYSNLKITVSENVAEHSSIVANISIVLAMKLNKFENNLFDLKDLAYRSIIHDYGESVTCDITTDVKRSDERLPILLEDIESKLLEKEITDKNLLIDIKNCKDNSPNGYLIKLSDRLHAYFKLTKEYLIQRTEIFKISIIGCGNSLIDILNEMIDKNIVNDRISIMYLNDLIKDIVEFNDKIGNTECLI